MPRRKGGVSSLYDGRNLVTKTEAFDTEIEMTKAAEQITTAFVIFLFQ